METRLLDKAIYFVARELARPEARKGKDWWQATADMKPAAQEKINAMTNIELLELIERVLDDA